jgi:glycosyltransferase involved in cell wall biosynthesis
MKELRVLHIGKFYPPHMGGIETHLQTLCERLIRNADVSVLVANDHSRTEQETMAGVRITRIGKLLEVKSTALCPGMTTQARNANADIVHLHLPNPTGAIAYLKSRHKAKLVVTYHSDVVRQRVLSRLFEPILNTVLSRAGAIIATSPNYLATSEPLQSHRDRCHVIPYGIPIKEFDRPDLAQVADIQQRFGSRIVVAVGRLVYYKGFEYVIRAMEHVDAKLLIIGEGPLRSRLEKVARDLTNPENVVFLGEIDNRNIAPYYHAAQVFALPSIARSEAFGIVQLEAMMCGLPVVNTRLDSGVPYVSQDGVSGITVTPKDPDALSTAINFLLDHPEVRQRYSSAARNRIVTEFDADLMAHQIMNIYRMVLSLSRRTESENLEQPSANRAMF